MRGIHPRNIGPSAHALRGSCDSCSQALRSLRRRDAVIDESRELRAKARDEPLAKLLEDAVLLTRQAGDLTLSYFRSSSLDVEQKTDGSPVTRADRQAERLIREQLELVHPDDGIVGEE